MKKSEPSTKNFRPPKHKVSSKGRKSVLIMKEYLWTNNINFVKDVPMWHINLILIEMIVSEKK